MKFEVYFSLNQTETKGYKTDFKKLSWQPSTTNSNKTEISIYLRSQRDFIWPRNNEETDFLNIAYSVSLSRLACSVTQDFGANRNFTELIKHLGHFFQKHIVFSMNCFGPKVPTAVMNPCGDRQWNNSIYCRLKKQSFKRTELKRNKVFS